MAKIKMAQGTNFGMGDQFWHKFEQNSTVSIKLISYEIRYDYMIRFTRAGLTIRQTKQSA